MKKIILIITLVCSISLFSQNITNPDDILTVVDSLVLNDFPGIIKKINYPPDCTVIRVFKQERECEIWAKDSSQDSLSLIMTLPICSMDFKPGPKLKQRDYKTPEGFYYGEFSYYSSNWFMWLDLNNINQSGRVGTGSAFRICLNYPNNLDQRHTQSAGFGNTGGGICVHGNCVSIGCISFSNDNFLPVYAFSRHHNSSSYGKVQYHIFPFRFSEKTDIEKKELSNKFVHKRRYSAEKLRRFWNNLEFAFNLFNDYKMPLSILTNRTYLKKNDLSETITIFKKFLKQKGYYKGKVDYIFDSELKSAVVQYQNEKNITADGDIGNNTINKMSQDGLEEISIEYIYKRIE